MAGESCRTSAISVRGQAAKELELDDSALARIDRGELIERVLEGDEIYILRRARLIRVAERNFLYVAAAFAGGMLARVVHENAPHHDRCETDELRAVPPVHLPLVDQPKVRLVDERGRLERVIVPLAKQIRGGEPAQLVVHERQYLIARALVAVAPVEQQPRNAARRGAVLSHISRWPESLGATLLRVSGEGF